MADQNGIITELLSEGALRQLDEANEGFEKLEDKIFKVTKAVAELNNKLAGDNSLKSANESIKEITDSMNEFTQLSKAMLETQKQANTATKEKTKTDKEHAKELQNLTKDVKAQQKELEALAERYKKAQKAFDSSESKRQAREEEQAYKQRIASHKAYQAELKKSIAETDKKIAANARLIEQLDKDTNKELDAIRKKSTAYAVLNSAHKRLVADALEVGAKFGEESKEFKDAAAAANVLDAKLKSLHAQLGDHRRNVGNYASAWNGLNSSIGYIVSEIPNFGISFRTFAISVSNNLGQAWEEIQRVHAANQRLIAQGEKAIPVWKQVASAIFSWKTALYVGIAALTAWGSSSDNTVEKVKILTDKSDALREANKNVSNSYVKQATELQILKERFQDTNASVEQKEDIVRKLNKSYGDTIGKIGSINDAEKFFVERSEAFVKALTIRAQMQGAYDAIADNQKKLFDQSAKSASEATNWFVKYITWLNAWKETDAELTKRGKHIFNDDGEFDKVWNQKFAEQQEKTRQRLVAKTQNDVDKSNKILKDFIKTQTDELNKISKENGFGFDMDPKEKKDKKAADFTNEELSVQERINKAMAEERKVNLEDVKNKNQLIIDDEKQSAQVRIKATTDFVQAELALNSIALNTEIENIAVNLDRIEEIEKKSADKRTNEEKALLLQKTAFLAEFNAAIAKYKVEEGKIYADGAKRVREITYKEQEDMNAAAVAGMDKIANYYQEKAEERIKTEKLTGDRAADVRKEALKQTIQDSIDYLETMMVVAEVTGESIEKIKDAITALQGKLNSLDSRDFKQVLREIQEIAQYASEGLQNTIKAFGEDGTEAIDAQIDALERYHDVVLAQIDEEATSVEDKNRRIAIAEAELFAKRDQLEQKKREQQQQQAVAQKAAAIFQAIINTAVAVTEKLATPWVAAAIGFAGAAQVAAIAAAPLPQYKGGTGPDGKPDDSAMVVGDGYRKEYIETKDGSIYETPAVPTLVTAPELTAPGTIVHKSFDALVASQATAAEGFNGITILPIGLNGVVSALNKQHETNKQIKSELHENNRLVSLMVKKDPVKVYGNNLADFYNRRND